MPARRPLIAANWKMNLTLEESSELAKAVVDASDEHKDIDIMIAPPYTALTTVGARTQHSRVQLGGQDLYWEESGAYTGAVSPLMLKDAACDYAIVAHSERRQFFGETDKNANRKVLAALTHDLIPILCVGETDAERDRGVTYVVRRPPGEGSAQRRRRDPARKDRGRLRAHLGHRHRPDRNTGTSRRSPPIHPGPARQALQCDDAARQGPHPLRRQRKTG